MLRTFRLYFAVRKTYKSNSTLYALRQLPILKKILPYSLSKNKVGNFFSWLFFIGREIASIVILNLLYYVLVLSTTTYDGFGYAPDRLFLHKLIIMSVIGAYFNVDFMAYSKEKYYSVILFKMNAKEYTLTDFAYSLVRAVLGAMPFTLFFGLGYGVPLWFSILIPFCVAVGKFVFASYIISNYKRTLTVKYAGSGFWGWIVTLIFLAFAFGTPLTGFILPTKVSMTGFFVLMAMGLFFAPSVFKFDDYLQMCKIGLNAMQETVGNSNVTQNKMMTRKISDDTGITSSKQGFEYFNELFIKRHKKFLWEPSLKQTVVLAIVSVAAVTLMILMPDAKEKVGGVIINLMPYFLFIVYVLNRGSHFTNAMFINCDHSMLTFSFYKRRNSIVKLFVIRLREIIKVNLLPAFVLGLGLASVVYVAFGSERLADCIVIVLTVVAESILFSIHYLTLYYLLQPYNTMTEIKSPSYFIASSITYMVCFVIMLQRIPALIFGLAVLAFSAVYCVVACLLVYRLAPKTFRLRN